MTSTRTRLAIVLRLLGAGLALLCAAPVVQAGLYDLHIDPAEIRGLLVGDVHRINGGLLGNGAGGYVTDPSGKALPDTSTRLATDPNAAQGIGPYITGWDGFFRTAHLTRQFEAGYNEWWDKYNGTPISQSRAIYINSVAARHASGAGEIAQFTNAANLGAQFLYREQNPGSSSYGFRDPTYGGYYWGISPPEVAGQPVYGTYYTANGDKSAYGQVHPIFALANAYKVTGDVTHLNAALNSWDSYVTHFQDTGYTGPYAQGAFLADQNEDFSAVTANRNLDYMCHTFESAYMLWETLPDGHARKSELQARTEALGNFITNVMYQPMAGDATKGYIPWQYNNDWTPNAAGNMSIGHNFEYAFLLNRAVEHGLGSQTWLDAADAMLNFGMAYGTDHKGASDEYFFINHGDRKFDGTDVNATEDIGWWQQMELNRALAYYVFARGRLDLLDEFDAAWLAYREKMVDQLYGGTFRELNATTLDPVATDWLATAKVWQWKVYYHEAMMYDELLRLESIPEPSGLAVLAGLGMLLLRRRRAA
jgi:hypothetical protein